MNDKSVMSYDVGTTNLLQDNKVLIWQGNVVIHVKKDWIPNLIKILESYK